MFDGESFGEEIVASVKAHVASSIAPLLSELTALKAKVLELESREPLRGEKGDQGPPGESIIGPKGDPGSAIICGKGPPADNGRAGDIYLDIEAAEIYQFRS